ncbi:RB1-inducible coiled-coil protein 1 isoform X2 [Anopheles moucheti]|uniref:RB1-inducible coiled-coil protein 1 isoform X2 n=1 Tax=Anopheles moucheti TaxID=186751 RepID=UPI0022F00768|nr:RB1-inducible coiled-coil protein 1 isoform X2 [Anopheles moucheti]
MFIFHVDQGRMLTFKTECMMNDIRKLKEMIERNHAIPARNIVLLVSGGVLLHDDSRACDYATGTDTNPIYMFCKTVGESPLLSPGPIKETEVDLEGLVRKSLELPISFSTLAARAQLAQNIYEMGREELRRCEALVHEQHLQQQGWAAVVANMEDTIKEFQARRECFNAFYEEQLEIHGEQMKILEDFDKSLQQLADIPILSPLMENAESRPYGVFNEVFNPSITTNSGTSRTASNNKQSEQVAAGAIESSSQAPTEGRTSDDTGTQTANLSEPQNPDAVESGAEMTTAEGATNEIVLTEVERARGISLLDWISERKGHLTLKRMAEECRINIDKFNRAQLMNFNERIDKAVKQSQSHEIKVVKGLEERLRGLDELLATAKKLLDDQNARAQGILKNQERATKIGDVSVLPDLCSMHQNTLQVMKGNHENLLEYRRRCTVAKDELGFNLTKRVKYIMNVETRVHELDSTLQLYHTSLQRLRKHLNIIDQIHLVPSTYVSAVTEVVRRRMFSSAFLKWASDLACRLMMIYNEEVARRDNFAKMFEGHFLSTLFPGMNDMPPSYAIQAPSVFDSSLPALDKQDLVELSRYLPELTERYPLPNIASVIDFFQARSVEQQRLQQNDGSNAEKDDVSIRSKDNANASSNENVESSNVADQQTGVKESDKIGAESETDTEDYEKVQNQSPLGGCSRREDTPKIPVAMTCTVATCTEPIETVCAETLTEDNIGTTRLEVERLKGLLSSVHQLSQDSMMMLRDQLARVRAESETNRTQFQSELSAVDRAWNDIQQMARNRERETIQQLTVDHELEMNDLRKSVHQMDDEIQSLRSDNSTMKASHIETVSSYEQEKKLLNDQIAQMHKVIERQESQLANSETDHKQAIQEVIEQLEHKHRTEIESLRCRFKLMATSMDRSPSDTSLEKIEKPDMIDIGTHEQLLAQVRDDCQQEKERAVRSAVEEARQRWEANAIGSGGVAVGSAGSAGRLHRSYGAAGSPSSGSQDVYKRILDEKDRQLDELRDKESQLLREVMRMRETIQSLTDPELSPLNDHSCREQLEALETDRQQMTEELVKLHEGMKMLEMEKSTLSRELEKHRKDTSQLLTCSEGDTVTYVWNPLYAQYTIVQVSDFIYFMHESSYKELAIMPPVKNELPSVLFGFGTVMRKDFCHARKDDNRYGVSRGTQFYRVKLKAASVAKKSKGRPWSSRAESYQQPPTAVVTIEMQSSSNTAPINSSVTGRLIDSFAQTEQPSSSSTTVSTEAMLIGTSIGDGSKSPTGTSRDMIDSGVVEQQRSSYRERNISITDEDDLVAGIGSTGSIDRIRYQSVCEEDDPAGEDDTDGGLPESTGGSSSATDYPSCYTSATSIVAIRTAALRTMTGSQMRGSPSLVTATSAPTIIADSGNNSEASTASVHTHPLSTNNDSQPAQSSLTIESGGAGYGSIADDVSDSADSEYRSLEGNDPEDSDSAAAPLPKTQDDRSDH